LENLIFCAFKGKLLDCVELEDEKLGSFETTTNTHSAIQLQNLAILETSMEASAIALYKQLE